MDCGISRDASFRALPLLLSFNAGSSPADDGFAWLCATNAENTLVCEEDGLRGEGGCGDASSSPGACTTDGAAINEDWPGLPTGEPYAGRVALVVIGADPKWSSRALLSGGDGSLTGAEDKYVNVVIT